MFLSGNSINKNKNNENISNTNNTNNQGNRLKLINNNKQGPQL
jgi:hypothetical protein|tara:strand:- start:209 stop:337 length:129 start_codon:yes stop_codon:yes gene_type:complete